MSEMITQRRAKKSAKRQKEAVAKQRQIEDSRLAEEEGEIAKRRAAAKRPGGRSLLIATSATGVKGTKLGGGGNA